MNKSSNRISFTIRFTIFTVFSTVLVVLMSVIISFSYLQNKKSALATTDQLMEQTSEGIFMKIENLFEPLLYVTDQAVDLPILGEKPTLQNHPAEKFFLNTMESYPHIQILYIGYSDGDFYEVLSFKGRDKEELQENINAPEDAEFGILRQFTPSGREKPVRLWKFLNKAHQTIGSMKQEHTGYDPRTRPWYLNAHSAPGSVKTDPYLFSNIKKMGFTISRKIDGKVSGVLGADILLDEMARFLEETGDKTSGLIFIFNEQLEMTAAPLSLYREENTSKPELQDFGNPEIRGFIDYLGTNPLQEDMELVLEKDNHKYLIKIQKLPEVYSNNEYLFFAVPEEIILGPAGETAKQTAIISSLIFIIAFPIIFLISRHISYPINKLEAEAIAIRNLNLKDDIEVFSRISEVNNLSSEMAAMKRGLRSFNRYVPSKLVKRLIESGAEETIGGESRELTILFSDIEGFTTIAESSTPEELMKRLSDYFEILSAEIRKREGTVDKFIGDAVMAFWNAPFDDPDHALHACESALYIQRNLAEIQKAARTNRQPGFKTRMGIHSGTAVVGNVGSMDRMNYTAIGDLVNSASRLEGINKIYRTSIIIGDTVVGKLSSDMVCRPLEKIVAKGKTESQEIYELIGYREDCSSQHIEFASLFTEGFKLYYSRKWKKALDFFEKAALILPEDPALVSFIKSSHELTAVPPDEDWSGVRVLRRK